MVGPQERDPGQPAGPLSGPSLRPARERDIDAIIALHRRSWREGFRAVVSEEPLPADRQWRKSLAETLVAHDPSILLAELEGKVCGFVNFGSSRDAKAPPTVGEVRAMFVDPGAWRQGIGSALMGAALAALRERGFDQVTVWTFEQTPRSRSFYEALGFRTDGARQRRFRAENAAEIRYRRSLPSREAG
jgi:GNAT superfamily N-acetyltransferase